MKAGRRIATLALAAGFCLAAAQDAPEIVHQADKRPMAPESFAATDKTCGEWTDGCTICLRRKDGTAGCSIPGIACQPGTLTCSRKVGASDTTPR